MKSGRKPLLLGLLLVFAAGCRQAEPGAPAAGGAAGGAAASAAAGIRQIFDGGPAGIQLGPGWYEPEPGWGDARLRSRRVAYTNRIAEVYFAAPPFADAELVAACHPLSYLKAPPQAVAATLNGAALGTFPLRDGWAELRLPLPAAALLPSINSLVLTFDHAAVPAKVGMGGDTRELAAVFDTLAIVPRGSPVALGDVRPAAGGRPDVFIYLVDALRADALGVYGAPLPVSPRIDAFAREAVVFDRARSPASWTLPATFSILSGRYPFHHGVHLPGDRLPKGSGPWLPALLDRAGYETLGISQWMLGGDAFGLEHGFGSFFFNLYQNGKMPSATARWFLAESLRRRRQPERPLFAFLHTVDPHAPYDPTGADLRFAMARPGRLAPDLYNPQIFLARGLGRDPADVAHLRGLYDGEVAAADREFGAFLDLLRRYGLYEESLIALVADHGEEFGEHGGFDHGRTLFDELLRVPLAVKLPRSLGVAPRRVAASVSTVDLAPTVLALAGRDAVPGFDGESLLAVLRGPGEPRALYSETRVEAGAESPAVDLKAVTRGDLKCIREPSGKDQLGRPVAPVRAFDLARDPGERSPLPAGSPQQARCRAELERLVARAAAESPPPFRGALPDEGKARLRALGYL